MKGQLKLWLAFSVRVTLMTAASVLLVGSVTVPLTRRILPEPGGIIPWIPVITFIAAGVFVSSFLIFWISRHFFAPIEALNAAISHVASGNFDVRLPEEAGNYTICQMNRNFNKMARELNSIEMLQSGFIQNVSHEIKTPLAAIEGYAALLEAASLPGELGKYTRRIVESSRKLSSLTGNILKLSRLEKQEIIPEKAWFSLDEQLRESVLSLEPLWSGKDLEIDIDLPPAGYYGNADLLWQVWTNLLSNAIKFTPEGGFIQVSLSQRDCGVSVQIRDTGIGMTPEVQKHMFEKFYQGERSRNIEGNGLGLPLVQRIVNLCGGRVRAESQEGKGTRFEVWLPGQVR